jgi:hypothetical protein
MHAVKMSIHMEFCIDIGDVHVDVESFYWVMAF